MTKHYFAADLGATSGRTILGTTTEDGQICLEELTRFPNRIIQTNGHYHWDLLALYQEILNGLKAVAQRGIEIESIGIDTWGVDVALFGKDGGLLRAPYSYRDPHTMGEPERFFAEKVSREEVYGITGTQVMNFNTLYQLSAMRRNGCSALENAAKILFLPNALAYMLTGQAVTEYTIASTSQMLNPKTKELEPRLLEAVGVKAEQFGRIVMPGTVVGTLTQEVQEQTGLGAVKVVAVAGHDTASAVAAVPAHRKDFAYLSSGTWSLMGVETEDAIINEETFKQNYTNEGGIGGTTRFLNNICGMWLLERCRAEWTDADYGTLINEALAAQPFRTLIYPDHACFANPQSMTEAIRQYAQRTGQPVPEERGQFVRCIFESLALRYREVFGMLKKLTPVQPTVLHIIGGGSRNAVLNQMTANAIGSEVIAGPTECTALGNIMVQAGATRKTVAASVETSTYLPQDTESWEQAAKQFEKLER